MDSDSPPDTSSSTETGGHHDAETDVPAEVTGIGGIRMRLPGASDGE